MDQESDCKCHVNSLRACPKCVQTKVKNLEGGDTLVLKPGNYDITISLDGLRGTANKPITIRGTRKLPPLATLRPVVDEFNKTKKLPAGHAVINSGHTLKEFRLIANSLARRRQAAGSYPGVYYVADEAGIHLRDCQYVELKDLFFTNAWPTAVYIDNCQNISVKRCRIFGGTFAIGATGRNTRHLLVEDCEWQQNVENKENWDDITWRQIHANFEEVDGKPVDLKNDWRCYDGDFFCGWQIAGFVTIRGNIVSDAFNAIHLFNLSTGKPDAKLCRNVLIENNKFERIRDNSIEPERGAWNWVIRHNTFIDNYREMSWELRESGYFYVYGNVFWHTQKPGGTNDGQNNAHSIFKFSKQPHVATGPHYFFHNSIYIRGRIAKKYRFDKFKFFNNAAICGSPTRVTKKTSKSLYGVAGYPLTTPFYDESPLSEQKKYEKQRFTKAWEELEIEFYHNVIQHPQSYQMLGSYGFRFGRGNSNEDPGFKGQFKNANISKADFKPKTKKSIIVGNSSAFVLETSGWQEFKEKGGRDIGAWQSNGKLFELPIEFEWIAPPPADEDTVWIKFRASQ